MIQFASPAMLYGLAAVPLLAVLFWAAAAQRRLALASIGDPDTIALMTQSASSRRRGFKVFLILLAFALLIVALARPQMGTRIEKVKREGIDIVVAIDTSKSMLAKDIQPSRIKKAKHEVKQLIKLLKGDRIGFVVFQGASHVQCPLTLDYGAAELFLDNIEVGMVPAPGTAVGDAIKKSMSLFEKSERKYKAIILFSDGEDTLGDPLEAAKEARKEGIRIYPIGIGTTQGEPIPIIDENGQNQGFQRDEEGGVVLSKMDETTLEKIALHTSGKYYPSSIGEIELSKIYDEIDQMEKKELTSRKFTHFEDRFQWPVGLAFALLIFEICLGDRAKQFSEGVRP